MQPILLDKPVGLTPYQAIQLFKEQHPQHANSKISAAGRLDPMAEGLLILLVDQDNKLQASQLQHHKKYRATFLCGVSTDSYDLLGVPHQQTIQKYQTPNIQPALQKYTGNIQQAYPPYSAVQVNGHPLYYWARKNMLDSIDIPISNRTIISLTKEKEGALSNIYLLQYIDSVIGKIHGNYRQQSIVEAWHTLLQKDISLPVIQIQAECSSGTYIRSLIHSLGQEIGTPTTTLSIKRLAVGSYSLDQAIQLNPPAVYHVSNNLKQSINWVDK